MRKKWIMTLVDNVSIKKNPIYIRMINYSSETR